MSTENSNKKVYPCPCCGYLVFNEIPGSYEICPICFWEDDLSQLRFPYTTGANHASLVQAQRNYIEFGACEEKVTPHVRKASQNDVKDPEWRIIDESKDNLETPIKGKDYGRTYPSDYTVLYYWSSRYWRKKF